MSCTRNIDSKSRIDYRGYENRAPIRVVGNSPDIENTLDLSKFFQNLAMTHSLEKKNSPDFVCLY
ncbi:conserved hypothetical protein [Burkholderia cepacia]